MEQSRKAGASPGTKIKICGLRRPEDIEIINRYRPDFAGFICSEPFWRYVPEEKLGELTAKVAPGIRRVGVFVDDSPEKAAEFVRKGLIDIVQLHGQEDEYYIRSLRKIMVFYGRTAPVVKAFRIRSAADITAAAHSIADLVLLDGGTGSGKTFDWQLIRDIGRDYFLAGGLNPGNIREAVGRFHPFAVDVSSGVETDRIKDPEKIEKCIEAVRS